MSDHDANQPPASGSPRPSEGDEFNARTVLINQDLLDAARAESQQAPGQVPGAVPGAQAQAGSWRPVQPDLPAGPPPEEQTRAYPAGAGRAATQPGAAPAAPHAQGSPYAQQSGADPFGPPSSQPQPGQHAAQPAAQPTPYNQPAQPAWGAPRPDDGAAATSSPGIPSAPGASSDSVAGGAPGAAAGQEPLYRQDQQASAQQPHPFSGGRHDGDVGMSSVFPTATARAEAEQMAETYVPQGAVQPVAQSSSAPSVQSQGSAPQWGSAPSSDAAVGQAPAFSDVVPAAAGAPFGQPAGGGALAQVQMDAHAQRTDSLGSWILATFVSTLPVIGFIYLLVLAFGGSRSSAKKNWARALFFWQVVGIVVFIVFWFAIGAAMYAGNQ